MRALGIPLLLAGILLSACEPSEKVGRCNDRDLATARVYDSAGFPAYAGQALVEQSCANGSFCHSSGIPAANRIGAPHGLDFDMVGSRSEGGVDAEAVERLRRGRQVTFEWRDEIYGSVKSGFMPPGEAGQDVISDFGYRFADEGSPLPPIDSEEAMEILQQWLACGLPVVGSITPFPTDMEPVGDVVPRGPARMP